MKSLKIKIKRIKESIEKDCRKYISFRTGKLCFPPPAVVVVSDEDKPEQGEMGVMTDRPDVSEMGNSAAFGPEKPNRTWGSRDYLQEEGNGKYLYF